MLIITSNGLNYQLTQKAIGSNGRAFGLASKIGKRGVSKRFAIASQNRDGSWYVSTTTH